MKTLDDDVKIPTKIANDTSINVNHISKVLKELKNKSIVECMNEEAYRGRLYRLTDTGKDILENIKEKEKKDNKSK